MSCGSRSQMAAALTRRPQMLEYGGLRGIHEVRAQCTDLAGTQTNGAWVRLVGAELPRLQAFAAAFVSVTSAITSSATFLGTGS